MAQCKRSFNAGEGSLQNPVACKRKLNAPTHHGFTAPVLHVSGCSSDACSFLHGRYTSMRWHHGKPLYQKEEADGDGPDGCVPVVLYFWDQRDGKRFHGWWFSQYERSSDEYLYAYNLENHHPEDLRVPTSGWKHPFKRNVDLGLHITKFQNMDEHRWEFEANEVSPTAEEEEKDWRPMSKAMSTALEDRWIQGWDGDNGTDDFQINVNGCIYGIHAHSMWQWTKTHTCEAKVGRAREIRRVEADHIEKRQVEESNRFLSERVLKLVHETAALMNSRTDHATQMMLLEAWRTSRQLQTRICTKLSNVDGIFYTIQKALIGACPTDHHGDCLRMRNFSITGIQQICNVRIWKDYEYRKEQVRKELDGHHRVPAVTGGLPLQACSWAHLDERINEMLLIHGTTVDKINEIANFGFDERLARQRGLYGQGVYFTDQSCKSLQYTGAKRGNSGCFIIARVILGHPFGARGPLKQLKVEPLVDHNDPSKGRCHSVIAKPGTPHGGQQQVHREFVLFDGAQAYPEMIVHFSC
eukprot:s1260_g19.t1